VGLEAEARIARRLGSVAVGGGLPAGAEAAAERLVTQGVRGLVSFGLAGGLDPGLHPGDVVVPTAVLEGDHEYAVDPTLAEALGGRMPARALAGDAVLADAAAKQAAWHRTGAAIVDLESGAVARVADRHRLPFAVLRAVCDPAARGLPPAALAALGATGRIGLGRVLASLLRQPAQLPALLLLARDAGRARHGLLDRVAALAAGWFA